MSLLDEDKNVSGNWTLICAVLALGVVGGAVIWKMMTANSYDEHTLCKSGAESSLTVVLFDKTGGFSENQKRLISKAINKEIRDLSTGSQGQILLFQYK
ncbi:hypothetical protein [Lacimicrobium alkaliphilum]|uniref:VWFA domain-containing protein n=2 Tax=Lacimicrobium alkaliphilum TaxID=1526571 RepID=A0ABQ1RSH8_9ALTE|nr:hypothetical protein [Lacimicrobium alkaliphilum]GGD79627.1 hypothetical protein GCM10011357_38210 [Lacimicrobium alkaliphilum]